MTVTTQAARPAAPTPPGRPGAGVRATAIVVGALLTVAVIGYGCLTLVSLVARQSGTFDNSFAAAGVRSVDVSSDGVGITVVGDAPARGKATVHTHVDWSWGKPAPRAELRPGGVLYVRLHCPNWGPIGCSGKMTLTVPRGVTVKVSSSGGGITAERLDGAANLNSSGGGIHVREVKGAVRADSSGGGIRVEDSSGNLDLDSSGGGVHGDGLRSRRVIADSSGGGVGLTFASTPDYVKATSSGGGVGVEVPAGSGPYVVDASSSGGGRHVDVPTDPRATKTVYVRSSGGGVRVEYAGS